MITAVMLEALQVFTPDRHADFNTALVWCMRGTDTGFPLLHS